MQKNADLVELEKCCQTHIFLQNFVLIQPRTSPPKICKNLLITAVILLIWARGDRAAPGAPAGRRGEHGARGGQDAAGRPGPLAEGPGTARLAGGAHAGGRLAQARRRAGEPAGKGGLGHARERRRPRTWRASTDLVVSNIRQLQI